ncbi:unnamed protein product [Haemonchus placei]|uniref:Uncharacterized protein n=1 Tax=Haemonchus placei TaxID=6290 RepID=A0A3P7YDX8_HAEPC|nr:unnamed protein product [Haemonchus placei]
MDVVLATGFAFKGCTLPKALDVFISTFTTFGWDIIFDIFSMYDIIFFPSSGGKILVGERHTEPRLHHVNLNRPFIAQYFASVDNIIELQLRKHDVSPMFVLLQHQGEIVIRVFFDIRVKVLE